MKRCTFLEASQPLPPLDFVLPGLLAGTAGLIVGPGAVGKTYLALQLAASIALGRPVCGDECTHLYPVQATGAVAVVLGEDPPEIVLHRLQNIMRGIGLIQREIELLDETLEICSAVDDDLALLRKNPASGEYHKLKFAEELERLCEGRRLVILDPLIFFAAGLDESSNGDMGALMRTLNQIAHKTGSAILVLHHIGKTSEKGGDDWEKARGASALTTSVRLQINLSPPSALECVEFGISPEDRGFYVRVAQVKANYSPPAEAIFLKRGMHGVLAAQRLAKVPQTEPVGKKGGRSANPF